MEGGVPFGLPTGTGDRPRLDDRWRRLGDRVLAAAAVRRRADLGGCGRRNRQSRHAAAVGVPLERRWRTGRRPRRCGPGPRRGSEPGIAPCSSSWLDTPGPRSRPPNSPMPSTHPGNSWSPPGQRNAVDSDATCTMAWARRWPGWHWGWRSSTGLLVTDPCSAKLLIADLKAEATNSVTDVRRVVYGPRPPALDEFGLVRAIAARIDRVRSGYPELVIRFDAPGQLPALSAAAEVAAYRIAVEALSNVALHARAHRCDLRILIAPGEELRSRSPTTAPGSTEALPGRSDRNAGTSGRTGRTLHRFGKPVGWSPGAGRVAAEAAP